jgi:hypothetical protein
MKYQLLAIIAITSAIAVMPILLTENAFGAITKTTNCQNTASGHTKQGSCPGNSENSPNKKECVVAKNPSGHTVPGQTTC